MAKIILNEGTEIEVKESKAFIRGKIKEDVRKEKSKNEAEEADHFIELNIVIDAYDRKIEKEIDLYYKRILYIYD